MPPPKNRHASTLPFPQGHGGIFALAALLLFVSSLLFVSAGEPDTSPSSGRHKGFLPFLGDGLHVYRKDGRFRLFLYSQWLGGAALMALPFYVVQAQTGGVDPENVPLFLGAQTLGALASNALWGHWGDRRGKQSLLEGVAVLRIAPPLAALLLSALVPHASAAILAAFLALFFTLGALVNGTTIAMLGYLMEISPDDRRPAYSGYFNAFVAPASLLPIIGGVIVDALSLPGVFVAAAIAAIGQYLAVRRLREVERGDKNRR